MTPNSLLSADFIVTEEIENTKTYKIVNNIITGYVDGIEALQQAIYKMLNTEKYEYPIYSFSYGMELESLIDKDPAYVRFELKRRIEECLLQDSRITNVDNFNITNTGDVMLCTFEVNSIYGKTTITKEVNI